MSNQPLRIRPKETANFGPLKAMTKMNWEENNPKLVQALRKNRTFEQVLESRVGQAILILQQCEEKGLAPDQARELAYEDLFLPSTEDGDDEL